MIDSKTGIFPDFGREKTTGVTRKNGAVDQGSVSEEDPPNLKAADWRVSGFLREITGSTSSCRRIRIGFSKQAFAEVDRFRKHVLIANRPLDYQVILRNSVERHLPNRKESKSESLFRKRHDRKFPPIPSETGNAFVSDDDPAKLQPKGRSGSGKLKLRQLNFSKHEVQPGSCRLALCQSVSVVFFRRC